MARFLCDLKVAELRNELEKRGVDKSGVKPLLMERLKEIILKEGFDPATFDFTNSTYSGVNLSSEESSARDENVSSEAATGRPELHLTSVSEGSIGAAVSEIKDKTKEDVSEQLEDAATFVVRVGENEEDLDYDIKGASTSAEEHKNDSKAPPTDENMDSEVCTVSKQIPPEKQAGKLQPIKTAPVCEQAYLRVSNLKLPTKAVDLKQLFSAHGRVISGKILASTRNPRGCVGFLKMASAEDAAMCIKKLDGTEFNCKIIKIEATDKVPCSISKTPKDGTVSGPVKDKSLGAPMSPKSRRYRGVVGSRIVSSRLIESDGKVGSASPYERPYRPSAQIIAGRYRKSAIITSHLARSLRRAQNFMHPAANSASVSAGAFRSRLRCNRDEADAAGDDKRSHFKIPHSRGQYYKKLPALAQCDSLRIRYDDRLERQSPYENRYGEVRESRSVRKQRNEFYPVPSEETYYRRESRFPSPQDETWRRPYIKPVVYRRPLADRFDEPIDYADEDSCSTPNRQRMRHSSSYEISSGGNGSTRFGFDDIDYKEHFSLRGSQYKSHQSSNRNSKDVHSLRSSMASNERRPSWRVSTSPALRMDYSGDRSRSPQIRTGGLNMPRSSLPPPVRYTRRSSPLPSPPFVAPHRRRSNYEDSSANLYSRRASGGYSYASGVSASSRDVLKDSQVIDYGHRPSSSQTFPNWQPSSRPQSFENACFPRGEGSGYSSQWRSPEYYSRQQARN